MCIDVRQKGTSEIFFGDSYSDEYTFIIWLVEQWLDRRSFVLDCMQLVVSAVSFEIGWSRRVGRFSSRFRTVLIAPLVNYKLLAGGDDESLPTKNSCNSFSFVQMGRVIVLYSLLYLRSGGNNITPASLILPLYLNFICCQVYYTLDKLGK